MQHQKTKRQVDSKNQTQRERFETNKFIVVNIFPVWNKSGLLRQLFVDALVSSQERGAIEVARIIRE